MLTSVFTSFSVFVPFWGLEPEKPRKTNVLTTKHTVFIGFFCCLWFGRLRVEITILNRPTIFAKYFCENFAKHDFWHKNDCFLAIFWHLPNRRIRCSLKSCIYGIVVLFFFMGVLPPQMVYTIFSHRKSKSVDWNIVKKNYNLFLKILFKTAQKIKKNWLWNFKNT